MIMVSDSAKELKRFLSLTGLGDFARLMVMRLVLAFLLHRGRMSCSRAAGAIRSEPVHRSQLTRFLARRRWQIEDFNGRLRQALLQMETRKGTFIFIIDATLCGQSGKKTENTTTPESSARLARNGIINGFSLRTPNVCTRVRRVVDRRCVRV